MTSLGAQATVLLLRLTNRRKAYTSVSGLMRGIAQTRKAGPARPTPRMGATPQRFQGRDVYTLRGPATATRTTPAARVLYLHGGGYVRPITRHHWQLIDELAAATGLEFVVPLYPLAPEHSGLTALNFVADLYRHVQADGVKTLVMGDSAGAGLALALAAQARDHGDALPERLVLITPFVDAELSHPAIERIAPRDPMLGIAGGREAARLYAGELGVSHPVVSPARAPLSGLPPMTLFVGTRDILAPDTLDYARRAKASGVDVDLRVGHDMPHVWPLMPFAEAKAARAEIAAILRSAIAPTHKQT